MNGQTLYTEETARDLEVKGCAICPVGKAVWLEQRGEERKQWG